MEFKALNGINTYAPASRSELIEYALNSKKILVAVNAEKILHATPELREIINNNIGYPDGIGAVWALNKKGIQNVVKIPGCELWLDIIQDHYKDKKFYLVGGKEEVIQKTIEQLKSDFPGIQIAGYRNGYIKTEEEKDLLIQDIVATKADIVYVAMGSPTQELLMEKIKKSHAAVYQGLGGSFDVYTGNVNRAPKWWVKNNLEWAYRLFKQPSRIGRQLPLVKFFILLKLNRF